MIVYKSINFIENDVLSFRLEIENQNTKLFYLLKMEDLKLSITFWMMFVSLICLVFYLIWIELLLILYFVFNRCNYRFDVIILQNLDSGE